LGYDLAVDKIQAAIDATNETTIKGYLKQQLAEHKNFLDPAAAQEIQISALSLNNRLLRPLIGASYSKLTAPSSGQAAAAASFTIRQLLKVGFGINLKPRIH
jgi:hypothetical protein